MNVRIARFIVTRLVEILKGTTKLVMAGLAVKLFMKRYLLR
jgi:hypothetical protein